MPSLRSCSSLIVLLLFVPPTPWATAQQLPLWRVQDDGGLVATIDARAVAIAPAEVGFAERAGGEFRFIREGDPITFAPNEAFAIDDRSSFTLALEIRTRRGEFATPLMCREGGDVHYSFVVGRHEGTIAFEPWCWARARAESVTRIDDGEWHRIVGIYDADSRRISLMCDGVLEADVAVPSGFSNSRRPGLRLGGNLDPNVRQDYLGELREITLSRGVPAALSELRQSTKESLVFEGGAAQQMIEAWNDGHRERRPPLAEDADAWRSSARRTRALVQDAIGLWPPPYSGAKLDGEAGPGTSTMDLASTAFAEFRPALDLDVRFGGRIEHEAWSVTRVYWQTFAGFHAGGWLYRPTATAAPRSRAAVLCPHGHWDGGATHPVVQRRCIMLARLGYVVLAVDSLHVEDTRIALSPLGAMTWNNLRGLELLAEQPDVDPARIGCTGASGGGQQSYYLGALDTGIAALVPAVMACHFHEILGTDGPHCHCNHTPFLAQWTDMPIMGASFAPRPQLFLTVTGDWTHEFPQRGFPEIAAVYDLLGERGQVEVRQWDKGHDYDRPMRNAMYAFFARHLLAESEPDPESEKEEVVAEDPARLRALERDDVPRDTAAIAREFRSRLTRPTPSPRDYHNPGFVGIVRARFERLFATSSGAPAGAATRIAEATGPSGFAMWQVRADEFVSLPLLVRSPTGNSRRGCAVIVNPTGKASARTTHKELVTALSNLGITVILADVRYTGELDVGANWRDLHGRFYGFDEGQLEVRDLLRVVDSIAGMGIEGPMVLIADQWLGAAALIASVLDGRVTGVVAPEIGPSYEDVDRRPRLARVLLHGDLPEAALASRANGLLLGRIPQTEAWSLAVEECSARLRSMSSAVDDEAISRFVDELARPR